MGLVRVKILDVSGSRSSEVEAPDDVAVNRILLLLVEKMNLPLHSPDGQIMSYKLHHRRTGQQLLDNQTFAQSGVQAGDELRLQPEITAGAAAGFGFWVSGFELGRRRPEHSFEFRVSSCALGRRRSQSFESRGTTEPETRNPKPETRESRIATSSA